MFAVRKCVGIAVALMLALPAAATELVMVEQTGCEWCARWNAEIAPAYPKTTEGKFAPLRRVDLRAMPTDLEIARRVSFTPTFLIVDNNQEIARLEGYPGQDFFWPLLDNLLKDNTDYDPETGDSK
ncbi:MAG: thioredoxin-related protein [Paracoccaceae bacterium]|jgi:thioredoxin-related protein